MMLFCAARVRVFSLFAVILSTPLCAAAEPPFAANDVAFYEAEVQPLLKQHCLKCHGADEKKLRGGLKLTNRAAVLRGGDNGPAVKLDKPSESLLLLAVLNQRPDGGEVMPPTGQLPAKEIAILTKWVKLKLPVPTTLLSDGDAIPSEEKPGIVTEASRNYWAYRPVVVPAVPKTKNAAAHPIDALLLAKLEAKGLSFSPPAEKLALLRRAAYDLTGLPPSLQQVDAFLKDSSPDAFAKVVDELLASPRYGEKWGRHWLDVVRYGETNGYERDDAKPFAWKYRDYVIRSLNEDKPYTQFVREQLAGDELPKPTAETITATGFYRIGIWDDEPADPKQALFDGYDDYVSVVGQGFLAMTLNCARCHDHKKDPIPQADYYRMVAFFRDVAPFRAVKDGSTKFNLTDISPEVDRKKYEGELDAFNKKVEQLQEKLRPLEEAAIRKMPPEDQLAVQDGKRKKVLEKAEKFLEGEEKEQYRKWRDELAKTKFSTTVERSMALSVNNCIVRPAETHILARGNPHSVTTDKTRVQPGFPEVLGGGDLKLPPVPKDATTSRRRTILADWIASEKNPLTARVIVNRVWHYHFGKGIVPSTSDFGKLGEGVSHPELLDWLAADFMKQGWTLKRLHRQLMLTQAYQQSSRAAAQPAGLKLDPANTLLWRFNMRRLAAEEVRDSILEASGELRQQLYGPSVYPKIPDAVLAGQSRPGDGWLARMGGGYDPKKPEQGNRRSIYVHVKRSLQVPILATHDQADTDSSCPVRYTTTVPTQALGMLNGEFTNEQAKALAARVEKEFPGQLEPQLERILRLTTNRPPTAAELQKDVAFVRQLQERDSLTPAVALRRFALLALNLNEFLYLD
ncbi:MAG: PSD1 and planctomycete cytochrome C domain-containing protein [Gemmataceae bacterium]